MAREKVKFVLNRRAFQQQVLMGAGTHALLEALARSVAPSGTDVEMSVSSNARNGGRARARIYDTSRWGTYREASEGSLSRLFGQVRL